MLRKSKRLRTNQGTFVTIDLEDAPKFKGTSITHFISKKGQNRFSVNGSYLKGSVPISRYLMSAPKGIIVDHINRNRADNRKSNLRFVNNSQNSANRGLQKSYKGRPKTSKYKGVSWNIEHSKWWSQIECRGKKYGSYHDTEIEAAEVYNKRAIKLFGEYAYLNKIKHNPVESTNIK